MFEGWGVVTAAVVAGGAVASSEINAGAAGKAASAQQNAANTASNTQLTMYNQSRDDQTPWRNAGGAAIGALSNYYGLPGADGKTPDPSVTAANDNKMIQSLPGYQFGMNQGNQAVQRDLAAKGLLGSGAAGKALTQYGQGYASQQSGQYLNGLQSLAGIGQTSVAQTGALGANAANQIGSNQIYAGNAQASGYANQANAVNSGLSGLVGAASNYNTQQNMAGNNPQYNAYSAPAYVGGSAPAYDPGTVDYSNNLSAYGG